MTSRFFVIIVTADALAPNWRQGISPANDDLPSVESVETKARNIPANTVWFWYEELPHMDDYSLTHCLPA